MEDPTLRFKGHSALFGMDGATDPSYLQTGSVAKAINRVFRGGKNNTRPPIRSIKLIFSNDDDKNIFIKGNFQGASSYRKRRPARYDGICAAIGGSLFYIRILGRNGYVTRYFSGLSKTSMMGWFCQCEEWMYFQNGNDKPIFWDGIYENPQARQSKGSNSQEMPIGTMMVYAHGRLGLCNQYNQIVFSDIIYGNGFTTTDATQQFTENTYWAEGGYFSVPADLGNITGIVVMPMQNVNSRGQGEVVIMTEAGSYSLDVSMPRLQWKDSQMQRTAMIGRGCMGPYSIAQVNGDIWYRAADGLASYTNSQVDFSQRMAYKKFSREVNQYLDFDTRELMQFESMIYFGNRVICSISPQKAPCSLNGYGSHRYCRGMVVADLDTTTAEMDQKPINWDGLWTGVRPTQMLKGIFDGAERAFVFSYDSDGINRLYEFGRNPGGNDSILDKEVPIESSYVTKRYDHTIQDQGAVQEIKSIIGGDISVSLMTEPIEITASYRSNNGYMWHPLSGIIKIGFTPLVNESLGYSHPRSALVTFLTPTPNDYGEGSNWPAIKGYQHQAMVKFKGFVKVDDFMIKLTGSDAIWEGDEDQDRTDEPMIQGEIEDDFQYLISR